MAYTTINKSTDYFNTVLYTGNGSNGRAITGVGHQPDLVWIKNRSATEEHLWYDAVRGADKLLRSNNTAGDATTSTTTYFNSFMFPFSFFSKLESNLFIFKISSSFNVSSSKDSIISLASSYFFS